MTFVPIAMKARGPHQHALVLIHARPVNHTVGGTIFQKRCVLAVAR